MKNKFFLLFALIWGGIAMAQPPSKDYKLVFEDNFDGDTLNTQVWRYRLDHRTGMGYMDGLNRAENVYVKDGKLYIECRQEVIDGKNQNTGGGIISLKDFGYGYYECLSKPFMGGRGVHTSFWQRGSSTPNNNIFEIDSYEIDSESYLATNNLYIDLGTKERRYVPWPHRAQVPFETDEDGWFLDAYEYTPEGVIFYDNGKEVARAEWHELNSAQAVWLTALNGVGKVDRDKQPCASVFEYFRFYAKEYPGVTLLSNGNFEFNQDKVNPSHPIAWTPVGSKEAVQLLKEDAARDEYKLRIGTEKTPFAMNLRQRISYILDGNYVLSAKVRSSGNLHQAALVASPTSNVHQASARIEIPKSNEWTYVSVPVEVRGNEVYISVLAEGEAGQWVEVDDINFMKPLPAGEKAKENKPFQIFTDAMWKLGMKYPVHFSGDKRFYFFDRNVGIGDTISVCFTLEADEKANMTPIARIPKKGNSGWAVQLTKKGDLIFRIGSIENHTDVVARKVYNAHKKVRIACCFVKGTALVYVNGKLVKRQEGIQQDTWDKTAAGRLGTVGKDYEAVGDVVMEMSQSDKETEKMKNFRGTLSKVQIYNSLYTE